MTDAMDSKLEQAYDLIRQERLDEALVILEPILQTDPDNTDAWWLYANAVQEPEEARSALQRVLILEPEHQPAQELLIQLNELYPALAEAEIASSSFMDQTDVTSFHEEEEPAAALPPDLPEDLPDVPDLPEEPGFDDLEDFDDFDNFDDVDDDATPAEPAPAIRSLNAESSSTAPAVDLAAVWDQDDPDLDLPDFGEEPDFMDDDTDRQTASEAADSVERRSRPRSILRSVLILLLIVLVGVLVVALIPRITAPAVPGTTPVAAEPTTDSMASNSMAGDEEAAGEDELAASEDVQTVLEAVTSAANAQSDLLGGEADAMYELRNGLPTIVIQVCRPAGTDISSSMDIAMDIAARFGLTVQDEIGAVGADLVNCERNDELLSATVAIDHAASYANGLLTPNDFRQTWRWRE
jgi:hypothetical protein